MEGGRVSRGGQGSPVRGGRSNRDGPGAPGLAAGGGVRVFGGEQRVSYNVSRNEEKGVGGGGGGGYDVSKTKIMCIVVGSGCVVVVVAAMAELSIFGGVVFTLPFSPPQSRVPR